VYKRQVPAEAVTRSSRFWSRCSMREREVAISDWARSRMAIS